MYYKLIKDMPKHDLGEVLYLNDENGVYEWLEYPNYILPKNIVENSDEYFEKIDIKWNVGDKIFFIDNCGDIVEHIFNPKNHLKLVLNKNAFRGFEEVSWVSEKFKMLLGNEIIICQTDDLLKIVELLKNNKKTKDNEEVIVILKKILNK